MLENANCAVIVIADGEKTDVWVEDSLFNLDELPQNKIHREQYVTK